MPSSCWRCASRSAIHCSTVCRVWSYNCCMTASLRRSFFIAAVSMGGENLKYSRFMLGTGMGDGMPKPGRRVRGSIDSWGSKVGSTARSTPLKIGPSTGFSSTSELSMSNSNASSAPTHANGTMRASHLAASRTKSGSAFHSSVYSEPLGLDTSLAPPGNSSTFSWLRSSQKAAMGLALTAPKISKKPPMGPDQCPGWAKPRTL
mmetsp:Transcript_9761/g.26460  ORF Transcript_9761/g.26460 Transcript_9761/m.26460 type:complete len:204 (+) Transcript_9761:764-1375(+)